MLSTVRKLTWKHLTGSSDDDWVEKINHKATVVLLLLFVVFTTSGQYISDPIHCWCPAFFTEAYVKYTKNYCWISNTYHIPMTSHIPSNIVARRDNQLVYYQWVPFILLIQALLFKLPNFIWSLLSKRSGIDMSKLCEMIDSIQFQNREKRYEQVRNIAMYINRWLLDRRIQHTSFVGFVGRIKQKLSSVSSLCCGQRHGHYLTGLSMFIKTLYCVNGFCQFSILNAFLALDFWSYGFESFKCMFSDCAVIQESRAFPRVTLCDFEIRQLQNLHPYTVQCVLPFNIINEKIFAIIWLWIMMVAFFNIGNFVSCIYQFVVKHNRELYVRKYLRAVNEIETRADKNLAKKFADRFLRNDGCFILRIVNKNTTDMFLSDVIKELWYLYKEDQKGNGDGFPNIHRLLSVGDEFETALRDSFHTNAIENEKDSEREKNRD